MIVIWWCFCHRFSGNSLQGFFKTVFVLCLQILWAVGICRVHTFYIHLQGVGPSSRNLAAWAGFYLHPVVLRWLCTIAPQTTEIAEPKVTLVKRLHWKVGASVNLLDPIGSLLSLTGPWIVLFAWNPTPAHLETVFPKFSLVVTAFADRVWHNFLEMKYCVRSAVLQPTKQKLQPTLRLALWSKRMRRVPRLA